MTLERLNELTYHSLTGADSKIQHDFTTIWTIIYPNSPNNSGISIVSNEAEFSHIYTHTSNCLFSPKVVGDAVTSAV